ncbi:sensor histidine kinase, partial [Embleya sp. NPDC127516]|uniref:sensor histidine kinase n=1 Tax=Embleya sp. NPDC127516 TaxID=3363990 RepID=UPI0038090317
GVRVDANLAGGVVSGDPLLLRQLVTNLVENAVRHNHPGGFVTVGVSAGSLRVRNTGPVIPADRIPELYEPFRRFRPNRTGSAKGSGLGLSIVQAIVQAIVHAHAARITTTANHHGGLTIAITLPKTPHPTTAAQTVSGPTVVTEHPVSRRVRNPHTDCANRARPSEAEPTRSP